LVADLTMKQATAVQKALDDMLRKRAGDRGIAILTNSTNIAIGKK
jgi:hypothetical protein